ncbi:MAG: PIN domain-containing protein [Chitinophagales bacterium]
MNYVLDTNIVLLSLLNPVFANDFERTYQPILNRMIISVVSNGELESLAIQRKWGNKRKQNLRDTLIDYLIHPIKVKSIIDMYAQIDAYSQGKLIDKPLPHGMSSRNMGKNDVWIAATAAITNSTLITTDKDFNHLHSVFFEVDLIDISTYY